MDLQNVINMLKEHGLLRVIDEEVDIDLEIPHIAYVEVKKPDSKALLFTKPVSKRLDKKFDAPVLMNVFGSYEATRLLMGKEPDAIASQIESLLHVKPPVGFMDKLGMFGQLFSLKSVFPKRLKTKGACQEVVQEEPDLYDIPVLTTWPEDGGPFITMGQVYTTSLDGQKHNLGMYRLQVYDKNHLGMHWQIHKDSAHFFHEYQKAGKKMPVSVAIGGDPLYIWCGQAPLPSGVFELMLYGFIKGENPRLVKSLTNPIYIPEDVDYVIEGWVDPQNLRIEGPFGDHTGYYTLKEPYPCMEVSCITHRKNPTYLSTVVGKPPLEDKYMGWATGRIFLPLLKTTAPELIDYNMPENGVFHNLIISKMASRYPGHAKQFMHAFWGVGQMSFVKHALFVGEDAPDLEDYPALVKYILNRLRREDILISEGVCDALDHSSPKALYGGKLGIDCTGEPLGGEVGVNLLQDDQLYGKIAPNVSEIRSIAQYGTDTPNPICVFGVDKTRAGSEVYSALPEELGEHVSIVIWVDEASNDVQNPYMLTWRIVNNIDAKRDIYLSRNFIGIDATNKGEVDGYVREWPGDTDCDQEVIKRLMERKLILVNQEFLKHYHV
jgi:4-hydroxy-3-polyprenylbenzoate decarboxylase